MPSALCGNLYAKVLGRRLYVTLEPLFGTPYWMQGTDMVVYWMFSPDGSAARMVKFRDQSRFSRECKEQFIGERFVVPAEAGDALWWFN